MADTTPTSFSTLTRYGGGEAIRAFVISTPTSGTYPTANRIIYIPFSVPWSYTVKRLGWNNGTAVAGNVELGIYNFGSNKEGPTTLVATTGATAQAGTSVPQYVTLGTPVTLSAGRYYLAIVASSASATFWRCSTDAETGRYQGLFQQDTASLPSTATPAQHASTIFPLLTVSRITQAI